MGRWIEVAPEHTTSSTWRCPFPEAIERDSFRHVKRTIALVDGKARTIEGVRFRVQGSQGTPSPPFVDVVYTDEIEPGARFPTWEEVVDVTEELMDPGDVLSCTLIVGSRKPEDVRRTVLRLQLIATGAPTEAPRVHRA